jgi:IPT/TIG domain
MHRIALILVYASLTTSSLTVVQSQEQTRSSQSVKPTPPASATVINEDKSKKSDPPLNFSGKLADAVNGAAKTSSDDVPCFFDRQELLEFRPKPEAATLVSSDAEQLRVSVIQEALDPSNAAAFEKGKAQEFAVKIGNTVFEGLTPSQATSTVLQILSDETRPATASLSDDELANFTVSTYGKSIPAENRQNSIDTAKQAAGTASTTTGKLAAITSALDGSIDSAAVKEESDKLSGTGSAAASKNNVAQASIQIINSITRPNDVFCSMTILSYETTRKAFGETMADEYIGVQIVVRNLSKDQEFLVQSAEFKVDDDINGRLGRYFTGVDKMTARAYMLSSRDLGKRNLMIHVAEGVGGIVSTVVPFTGPFVKQFSGVYSGGLLPALANVFPDHNTDQLKLIDDEGFSNSRTDRTVVPKSGTAEFVIFISAKEFEQGWWTQDCAQNEQIKIFKNVFPNPDSSNSSSTAGDSKPATNQVSAATQAHCLGNFNRATPELKCVGTEIGVDLEAARDVCLNALKDSETRAKDAEGNEFVYFKPVVKPYQRWKPRSLALFRELSLAVVAGTHVNEQVDTTPTLSKIDCPADDKGNVKLDSAQNGAITCTTTGTNLDKVAQLKLRNSQDATDTNTADGSVSTSGDSKSGKVSFPVDKLGALTASAYKVYTVTSAGVENGGDQVLHFSDQSMLTDVSPSKVDRAKLSQQTITLTGYHLDALADVCLSPGVASAGSTVKVSDNSATPTTKATLDVGTVTLLGTLNIYLDSCAKATTPSGKTLEVVAPQISGFTPTTPDKVGDTITINGSDLTGATEVLFGGKSAKPGKITDNQITVVVPSGAKSGDLTVNTPAGSATAKNKFVLANLKPPVQSGALATKPK